MNYLDKRNVPKDSQELRHDEINVVIYLYENAVGQPLAIAYSGKRSKPDFHNRFRKRADREYKITEYVNGLLRDKASKEEWQAERKRRAKAFKETIKVGSYLRTSFSYNMTFNNFYEVLSVKGSVVKLAELNSKWVSGDIGWTGDVSCTSERSGKLLEARFSVNGLKINDRNASICTLEDTFYENHMD